MPELDAPGQEAGRLGRLRTQGALVEVNVVHSGEVVDGLSLGEGEQRDGAGARRGVLQDEADPRFDGRSRE
eukprot:3076112-Lingulodinium_polyedra.AAC.1